MLQKILSFLALFSFLISFLNVWLAFRWLTDRIFLQVIRFSYLAMVFLVEATSFILAQNGVNNLFMFHIFGLCNFVLLSYYFGSLPGSKPRLDSVIRWLGVGLLLLNSIFIQPWDAFNSYGMTLVSLVVIFFCFRFFMGMLDLGHEGIHLISEKWFASGILLAELVSLIVLFISNFILDFEKNTQLIVWITRSLFLLLSKLIISFSLLKRFNLRKTD